MNGRSKKKGILPLSSNTQNKNREGGEKKKKKEKKKEEGKFSFGKSARFFQIQKNFLFGSFGGPLIFPKISKFSTKIKLGGGIKKINGGFGGRQTPPFRKKRHRP